MEIFAHHAHLYPQEERPLGSRNQLLKAMDVCDIAKCVVFAPMPHRTALDSPNQWLAKELQGYEDQLVGFGVVDVRREDIEAQVKEIDELGLAGIKLHPASQQFDLMGEKARRIYKMAQQLKLPISFHSGVHFYRISAYDMRLYDEISFAFPKLKYSMEHIGGYCFFNDGLAVMLNNAKGVMPYAGMTSVCDKDLNKYWYLNDQQIHDLKWLTGEDHMIFGLDFPYNQQENIKQSIKRFLDLGWSEQAYEKLFGGNLKKFLIRE